MKPYLLHTCKLISKRFYCGWFGAMISSDLPFGSIWMEGFRLRREFWEIILMYSFHMDFKSIKIVQIEVLELKIHHRELFAA